MADERTIDLAIDAPGTPETVWRAIATAPGISSWYVPHQVEERAGGVAVASFGEGPEMAITGRVAVWEPPHRIVFDKGDGEPGLWFEWTASALDDERCEVRLRNGGFGTGADQDAQYEAMTEGWQLFLANLRLHLTHFAGQAATASLPMAMWPTSTDAAWATLTAGLGVAPTPSVGDPVALDAGDGLRLAGTVADVAPHRLAVLVDEPVPGTAFVAAEEGGEVAMVSVWAYLYGPEGAVAVERDRPCWQAWLDAHAPTAP